MTNKLKNFYLTILFAGLTPVLFYAGVLNGTNNLFLFLSIVSAITTLVYFFKDDREPEEIEAKRVKRREKYLKNNKK